MQHAFGLSVLSPYIADAPAYLDLFTWYWGKTQGNTWSITNGLFNAVYTYIQYAGPTLTAQNVKKGLFSVPASGGAATGTIAGQTGYGKTVGLPFDEYALFGTDRGLAVVERRHHREHASRQHRRQGRVHVHGRRQAPRLRRLLQVGAEVLRAGRSGGRSRDRRAVPRRRRIPGITLRFVPLEHRHGITRAIASIEPCKGGTVTGRRVVGAFVVAVAMTVSTLGTAGAQSDGGIPVSTRGVGKPPPGAGMGTKAALENPKCNPDTVQGWGTFPMVTTTGGPYCVAPAPKNNGGATSRGVTGTTIKVVVVLPWPDTNGTGATNDRGAINRATGQPPTAKAAALDAWAALSHVYETWGRKVEFTFITASGLDETSQRADVVKIEQEKPMFVINTDSRGLGTLATTLAKDKYIVYSYSTTPEASGGARPLPVGPLQLGGEPDERRRVHRATSGGRQGGVRGRPGDAQPAAQVRARLRRGFRPGRVQHHLQARPRHARDTGAQLHRQRLTPR